MPIKISPTSLGIHLSRPITCPQIPRYDLATGSRIPTIGSAATRSDLLSAAQQENQQTQNSAPSEDTEVFHDAVLLSDADFERIKSLAQDEEIFKNPRPDTDQEPETAFSSPSVKKVSFRPYTDELTFTESASHNDSQAPSHEQPASLRIKHSSLAAGKVDSSSFSPLEIKLTEKLFKLVKGSFTTDPAIHQAFCRETAPFIASTVEIFFKALSPDMPNQPAENIIFDFDELDLSELIVLSKKMEPILDRYLSSFKNDDIEPVESSRKFNIPRSMISTEAATALRFGTAVARNLRKLNCEKSIAVSTLLRSAPEITYNIVSKNRDTSDYCVSTEFSPADLHGEGDHHTDMLSMIAHRDPM